MIYLIYKEDCCRAIREVVGYTINKQKAIDYCTAENEDLDNQFLKYSITSELEYSWEEVDKIED